MFWQSPESPLCEVPAPGLGSTSNVVNTCISDVECRPAFSLLLYFCSVQFAEALRYSLFDGTGRGKRALIDCCIPALPRKIELFQGIFFPYPGKTFTGLGLLLPSKSIS